VKKILYYHTTITEDAGTWSSIVMEQMVCMKNSGLLSALDELNVTVVSPVRGKILDSIRIQDIILAFYPEARFDHVENKPLKTYTENHTKRRIWNDSQRRFISNEKAIIGYVHTKGVTAVDRHLKSSGGIDTFVNYYLWRQFLNWGVIEQWRHCLHHLTFDTNPGFKYDVSGVNYFDKPCPHFSGNFWWSTSDYIAGLADPSTNGWWELIQNMTADPWLRTAPERHKDEMWICSNTKGKFWSTLNLNDGPINLSAQPILRKEYAG
jgi:hypothetical protein